jgi:integrase
MARQTKHRGVKALGGGRYHLTATGVDPKTGKLRKARQIVEAESASEAATLREEMRQDIRRGAAPVVRRTLRESGLSWLESTAGSLKASTRKTYGEALGHILSGLGDIFLDALELEDLVRWRDSQKASASTVNGRIRVLRTILRWEGMAILAGRLRSLREPTNEEPKAMTAEELAGVLGAVKLGAPQWYPLVLTLALTGLRWGEATALRWDDVDLEEELIRVRRAQWRGKLDTTKNETRRTVPVVDILAEALREHREAQVRRQAKGLEEGWVFPSSEGTLPFQSVLTKPLRAAAVACGMARWVTGKQGKQAEGRVPSAHWFRHTFNNMVRQVAQGEVVRAMTGHLTEEMTDHYSHVTLDERRQAVGAALRLVKG